MNFYKRKKNKNWKFWNFHGEPGSESPICTHFTRLSEASPVPATTVTTRPPNPQFRSVPFSCSVVSDSLPPRGLQHASLPCPSPTPGAYSDSCPSSQWCHPTSSSSVVPFSSCLHSFPASGFFPRNQFFTSGGQSIGVSASASVLPMNI